MPDQATVVFLPSGLRGMFPTGTTVLQAAQQLGVDLESSCGGRGRCGRCQVLPVIGEFPKLGIQSLARHLSPRLAAEGVSSEKTLKQDRRLGCCSLILGDLVVDVPVDSQLQQQHIVKQVSLHNGDLDPAIQLFHVRLAPPSLQDSASDLWRLQRVLEQRFQLRGVGCSLPVLQQLQPALADDNREISVAVYRPASCQPQLIAVWSGLKVRVFGLAIDLGSTTLAAHLCDLSSGEVLTTATRMNPQIRFGEDLMSRVSYVMMNAGGDREMTRVIREAFNELARDAAAVAGVDLQDILEITVVCNPIMHHLLLGIDPTPLGTAPFTLVTDRAVSLQASELDLELHPQARVFILPCLAGHVGADTAGVILAERPDRVDEMTLLVDVGTNAEIVLGNRHRLLAASSPTGPAFEGAQISCGQRAAPGAVERVRIDRQTLEPRFKIIGCSLWSDDPGFPQETADIGVSGICGSGIIELIAELFLAGVVDASGAIVPAMAEKSERVVADGRTWAYVLHQGPRVLRLTQNDIRAIQLAKAALYAGIRLLMGHLGVERVERIVLTGAFGSHIDVKYAMLLGLVPDCDLQSVQAVGNAAGSGACIALLDRGKRDEIERILRRIEKIETAVEEKFQDYFVDAMALPHGIDDFPELAKVVPLPERRVSVPVADITVRRRQKRRTVKR